MSNIHQQLNQAADKHLQQVRHFATCVCCYPVVLLVSLLPYLLVGHFSTSHIVHTQEWYQLQMRAGVSSSADANGFYTYTRPEGKSGGHGVGWSEIPRYSFKVPEGWQETPVSIADLGGTEASA